MKYFAGIGGRKNVPDEIADLMPKITNKLEALGYTLRSGSAEGSDEFFASGATRAEIWLPWASYNSHLHKPYFNYHVIGDDREAAEALKLHPAYPNLSNGVRLLMKRNFRIIKGSRFVVCWTANEEEGGTAFGIKVSRSLGIPVFNLYDHSTLKRIKTWLFKKDSGIKIVNIKDKSAYDLYCGRANKGYNLSESKWHNPFVLKSEKDRKECCENFRNYLKNNKELMESLHELDNKILACWCFPKYCHLNVLKEEREKQLKL